MKDINKGKSIGVCPICKENGKLAKSHIIPEGFHRVTYDEKGRSVFGSASRKKAHYIQNGRKEYLLCITCDRSIGDYDKYAKELVLDKKNLIELSIDRGVIWKGVNFNKFKLFHLSILLRAHLSKEVSLGVTLTESEEKELINYIRKDTAPDKYKYPIFAYKLMNENKNYEGCDGVITYGNIYSFNREIEKEIKVCSFIFGGFVWNYILSELDSKLWGKDDLEKLFLNEYGRLIIPDYDMKELLHIFGHKKSIERATIYRAVKEIEKMKNN